MEKGHNWGQAPALLSHLPRGAARGRSVSTSGPCGPELGASVRAGAA